MHLTSKQIQLLTVIAKGAGPGDPYDLDQILDNLGYETTKQSLQFSIRALIAKSLIMKMGMQKRRGRQRRVIAATPAGKAMVGIKDEPARDYIEVPEDPLMDIPMDLSDLE